MRIIVYCRPNVTQTNLWDGPVAEAHPMFQLQTIPADFYFLPS